MIFQHVSGARGRRFDLHSGRRVVSLSKIHSPSKSTGNTQEAVAPLGLPYNYFIRTPRKNL